MMKEEKAKDLTDGPAKNADAPKAASAPAANAAAAA
jgi:hypothetical protein